MREGSKERYEGKKWRNVKYVAKRHKFLEVELRFGMDA